MDNRVLLVVDVQREFSKDDKVYNKIVKFVNDNYEDKKVYSKIISTRYHNYCGSPFEKYLNWLDCQWEKLKPLDVKCDSIIEKVGYGMVYNDYLRLDRSAHYDIIGYNTDACVLKIAMDMFDMDFDINVLSEYCYSSSGLDAHKRGIEVMKSTMGNVLK